MTAMTAMTAIQKRLASDDGCDGNDGRAPRLHVGTVAVTLVLAAGGKLRPGIPLVASRPPRPRPTIHRPRAGRPGRLGWAAAPAPPSRSPGRPARRAGQPAGRLRG